MVEWLEGRADQWVDCYYYRLFDRSRREGYLEVPGAGGRAAAIKVTCHIRRNRRM